MPKFATRILGVLLLSVVVAASSQAAQYPPGPGGTCPDSLLVANIQNPASACHPATGDTVWGVGGIVTGFDPNPTGFAIYMQNNASGANGAPWTGIDVFTAGTALAGGLGLQIGDSIVVYGATAEFQGETEILSFNNSFSLPDIIVRKVSSGNTVPPFHVGTVAELQELPTNPNAEKWEGCLVRVNGPLRVVRTSGIGTSNSFLVVDDTVCPVGSPGPCDSLFVDGNTCSSPAFGTPPIGRKANFVQGIYNQRTRGYRIQLRNGDDIDVAAPPNLADAYPVHDDTIRVVFDRAVTQATAENLANYSLGSFRFIDSITQVEPNAVHVAISTLAAGSRILADGDGESINVEGVAGQASGELMSSQSRSFIDGVLTIGFIQQPNKAALGGDPCVDRSRFSGVGSAAGQRLTFRGVCTGSFGNLFYMMDGTERGGIVMFAPLAFMTTGRQYLIAGAVQEFFNETEGTNNVYIRDEGPAAIPGPVSVAASVLRNGACDATQSILSGEDYEDMLVRVESAYIIEERNPGQSFRIRDKGDVGAGFLDVFNSNNNTYTFDPNYGHSVTVTGQLRYFFGVFRVFPRGDSDIIDHGFNEVGVGDALPAEVLFAVHPNPARTARVSFGLPRAAIVELAVYDLQGRQVTVLENGSFAAGSYSREWNGLDARGHRTAAGVYFYRLRVGEEIRVVRGIRLD